MLGQNVKDTECTWCDLCNVTGKTLKSRTITFFQSLIPRKLNFGNSSPKIWLQLVKKQYGYNIETDFRILHFVKIARALVLSISIILVKITFIDFVCLVSYF